MRASKRISVRLSDAKSPVFLAKSATARRAVSDGTLLGDRMNGVNFSDCLG